MNISLTGLLVLLIIAGVCGGIGRAIGGGTGGGFFVSIAVGFVGALLGSFVAHYFHLPDGEGSKITLLFENVNDISINPGNSRELIETGNQAGLGRAVAESENVGDQLL